MTTDICRRLTSKKKSAFVIAVLLLAAGIAAGQGPSGQGPSSTNPVPGVPPGPSSAAIPSLTVAPGCVVGYKTDVCNLSNPGQAATVTATGATGVAIPALTGFDYSTVRVLWVDECNNGTPSADFSGAVAAISAFVSSGGVFVYNSRNVAAGTPDSAFLPGGGAISLTRDFGAGSTNIDVGAVSGITSGPFGVITNTLLDGGNSSDHGFATVSSLPGGSTVHLIIGGDPTKAVGFSYKFGAGAVYYATIPLDFYLAGSGNNPPRDNFVGIYAPNMITAACTGTLGGAAACATHVHGHTFLFGHGNPTAHFPGHTAGAPGHGHHFACVDHAFGHSRGLQAEPVEESVNPVFVAGLNQDGSTNGARSAGRGTVLQLFGSALGLFVGQEDDDQPAVTFTPPASGSPLHYTTSLPQVRIGGLPAKVVFSGLAPGLTGVWQINVVIPDQAPVGRVPVSVSYEGYDLRSVDITVE